MLTEFSRNKERRTIMKGSRKTDSKNGEVKTYLLRYPVNRDTFNDFPEDIKKAYVKAMQTKFGMNLEMFAKSLSMNMKEISDLVRTNNIAFNFDIQPTPEQKISWDNMIEGIQNGQEETWETLDKLPEIEPSVSSEQLKDKIERDKTGPGRSMPVPKRIKYEDFKAMSLDERVGYIYALQEYFIVSVKSIALDWFGLSSNQMVSRLINVKEYVHPFGKSQINTSRTTLPIWRKWCDGGYLTKEDQIELKNARIAYATGMRGKHRTMTSGNRSNGAHTTDQLPAMGIEPKPAHITDNTAKTNDEMKGVIGMITGKIHLEGKASDIVNTIKVLTEAMSDNTRVTVDLVIESDDKK